MATLYENNTTKISELQTKINEQGDLISSIQADPFFPKVAAILKKLDANHLNDGKHWYDDNGNVQTSGYDSKGNLTGDAYISYQNWGTWYKGQENKIETAQGLIYGYKAQIKTLQEEILNDPVAQAQLIKINYAQKNTQYFIIGGIVILIIATAAIIYFKTRKKA